MDWDGKVDEGVEMGKIGKSEEIGMWYGEEREWFVYELQGDVGI